MERSSAKIFLLLFVLSSVTWLYALSMKNITAGKLLKFGTVVFETTLDPAKEREVYRSVAEYSVIVFFSYPIVLITAFGFFKTTNRMFATDGWLLMSAILLFMFVPVELFCFWLDWKIVGLNYWGEWPLEEFRKAALARITALAGVPLIAQLCYFTIPVLVLWKPFSRKSEILP
ncbi:MAG: hypothetical protein WCX28_08920 [Bacteriovoracaceae bacterium]|nr:hypothetical protein [Bacteroidota bacterium]